MDRKEAANCYNEARKLGMKEYKRSISDGESGNLPFLEGLLKNVEIFSEVDLGLVEIPLKKIAGTYTYTRSISFSVNFMPILERQTEFADKWTALCDIHLKEGIRDPIKVYEYLNWFYVLEGNKRVSVLKHFNAYSIHAKVTRLIPRMDENDRTIKIYYEFLEFYKKTLINNIWFTRQNSFKTLLNLLEEFTVPGFEGKEKYKYFSHSVYLEFRKAYLSAGGGRFRITTGDAFLEYSKLYGIPRVVDEAQLKSRLAEFMTELESIAKEDVMDIQTDMLDISGNKLISTINTFVKPFRRMKVAFAYVKTPQKSNWTFGHEIGRIHVDKMLSEVVETTHMNNIPESIDAYENLKQLAEEGNDVIFATSPLFIKATLKAALEYTNTRFFNCSETHSFRHVNTYFGRIYEPRFLLGVIAGAMTNTNVLGCVGTLPFPGVVCGINAFALGARMVNPRATVKVTWTSLKNDKGIIEDTGLELVRLGADYISHQNTLANREFTREFGLYSVTCNEQNGKCYPNKYIAAPVWNWGIFYERIIRNILNESRISLPDIFGSSSRLVNYWWGMDAGVTDIFYSTKYVPKDCQKLIELVRTMIMNKAFHPFTGPVYDQQGNMRIGKGEAANHEQILNMDWFTDAVETGFPGLDKLGDMELLADMV